MENKIVLNSEEEKCLRKMFKLASLTKYTLIGICINFIPLIFLIINDFIRFENNVSRNFLSKYLYSVLIVIVILLILWSVFYIILRKNLLNNKVWQSILDKIDDSKNINDEVEDINSNIKSIIPTYLLGDLISLNKDLKEIGNTIKTISGIAVMALIIKSCSIIMRFIRKLSKAYNIQLKSTHKLFFVLFIIPAFVIIVLDISSVVKDVQNGNKTKNDIVDSLEKNCEQKSYCKSISHGFGDDINIYFNAGEYNIYSSLDLDKDKKIDSISTYLEYNKNISKEDIVKDVNIKLEQLIDLINSSNAMCVYDFICQKYQLPTAFIDKFYNMDDGDVDSSNTRYDYELENKYKITTYSYINQYSDPTDLISIRFIIDN